MSSSAHSASAVKVSGISMVLSRQIVPTTDGLRIGNARHSAARRGRNPKHNSATLSGSRSMEHAHRRSTKTPTSGYFLQRLPGLVMRNLEIKKSSQNETISTDTDRLKVCATVVLSNCAPQSGGAAFRLDNWIIRYNLI